MLSEIHKSVLICALLGVSLLACDPGQQDATAHSPVPMEAGDECHLCGMIITRFPGPKGEAFVRHNKKALKFCSTRDLFAWLLQPDVTSQVEAVYVHDMGETSWETPDDNTLVDARKAWYVIGSDRKGAMGHTLASFSNKNAADRFARERGGEIVSFEQIDLEMLQSM